MGGTRLSRRKTIVRSSLKRDIVTLLHGRDSSGGPMAIDIRRRELLVTFGGTAAWAFTARAQQVAKLWRIGYLAESQRQVDEIFRQSLRKLGYIEGSNLTMIYRWAQGGSFGPLA